MAKTFHLTIAEVGQNIFDGEVLSVTLPGTSGMFTVMANHEAFVSPLKEGSAKIKTPDGEIKNIDIPANGITEVSGNQATVIL
jgi:F-type H+-transporting ATPase subunit epsilon